MNNLNPCKICDAKTIFIGTKIGKIIKKKYHLFQCTQCYFSFIQNPDTNYSEIYNEKYYTGNGADPLIDYVYEIENPADCVRFYEWRGILKNINSLIPLNNNTRWLDFGSGNGGLVRYCRTHSPINIVGFEQGWIKQKAGAIGIPMVDSNDLNNLSHSFDIITAIEVLEHVENVNQTLKFIHSLLKPGGLFFYTTGNARPFRKRLLTWSYVAPEIHISFYEPKSLELALHTADFSCKYSKFLPGFTDIIRSRTLKNFKIRRRNWIEKILPWPLLSRVVNKFYQITAHPIAWAKSTK